MKSRGGRRKVLFGTNYPMIVRQPRRWRGSTSLGLDDETRELYLEGNAQRLLKLAERAPA